MTLSKDFIKIKLKSIKKHHINEDFVNQKAKPKVDRLYKKKLKLIGKKADKEDIKLGVDKLIKDAEDRKKRRKSQQEN